MLHSSTNRKHSIDFLFPIILFLVFAIAAISVILFAARVYQREVDSARKNYNTRISLEYLTEKVHRSDSMGAVKVGSFGGSDALILEDITSDGQARYVTYIYCLDGALRELYAPPRTRLPLGNQDHDADVSITRSVVNAENITVGQNPGPDPAVIADQTIGGSCILYSPSGTGFHKLTVAAADEAGFQQNIRRNAV